jgi:hypothetical protein
MSSPAVSRPRGKGLMGAVRKKRALTMSGFGCDGLSCWEVLDTEGGATCAFVCSLLHLRLCW